jgi:hypothetical protein
VLPHAAGATQRRGVRSSATPPGVSTLWTSGSGRGGCPRCSHCKFVLSGSLGGCGRAGVTGKDHAKWCPCATAFYHFQPDIRINHTLMETLSVEQKKDWVNSWPCKAVKYNDNTGQVRSRVCGRGQSCWEAFCAAARGKGAPAASGAPLGTHSTNQRRSIALRWRSRIRSCTSTTTSMWRSR